MTKEEFKKRFHDYDSQITNLKKKIYDLKQEYLKHCPFKVGDKVEVTKYRGEKEICFIGGVEVDWSHDYRYRFNKVRKDGSMSGQSAGIYSIEGIKLLTE